MKRIGIANVSVGLRYSGDLCSPDIVADLINAALEKARSESCLSPANSLELSCDKVAVNAVTLSEGELYTGLGEVHDFLDGHDDPAVRDLWKLVVDNDACTVFVTDTHLEFSAGPNSLPMVIYNEK